MKKHQDTSSDSEIGDSGAVHKSNNSTYFKLTIALGRMTAGCQKEIKVIAVTAHQVSASMYEGCDKV